MPYIDLNLFAGPDIILTDDVGAFTIIPKNGVNISVTIASPDVQLITATATYNVLYSDLNNPVTASKNALAALINEYL